MENTNYFFKAKCSLAQLIDDSSLLNYLIEKTKPRIIFGYHRILPLRKSMENIVQNCMWTSPLNLEKQILWMKSIGDIVSIEDIIDFNSKNSKPLFSITFDDGWKDNYDYAFHVLKKYNVPAMIFLSTYAIDSNEMFWPDEIYHKTGNSLLNNNGDLVRNYLLNFFKEADIIIPKKIDITGILDYFIEELKEKSSPIRNSIINDYYRNIHVSHSHVLGHILSWNNILEMSQNNITFGSHSHKHIILKNLDKETIINDLSRAKKTIEKKLNKECAWFCYPNARYNNDDHLILKEVGYRYGVTFDTSILTKKDSPFYLPRFLIYEDITRVLGYIKLRILNIPKF